MADLTADHTVRHLDLAGYVIMKKPPARSAGDSRSSFLAVRLRRKKESINRGAARAHAKAVAPSGKRLILKFHSVTTQ
jgi:hypothetical protein